MSSMIVRTDLFVEISIFYLLQDDCISGFVWKVGMCIKRKHLNREKDGQPLEVGVPYFQTNSYVFSKSFIMVNGSW